MGPYRSFVSPNTRVPSWTFPFARGPTPILSRFARMPSSFHPCRTSPRSQVNRLLSLQVRPPHHLSGLARPGYTSPSTSVLALYALSRISIRMFLFSRVLSLLRPFCFQRKLGSRFASWFRFWVQTPLRCPAGRNYCRDSPGDFLRFYPTLLGDPHPFVEGISM